MLPLIGVLDLSTTSLLQYKYPLCQPRGTAGNNGGDMSTQDGSSIPFEICNEQQNFRLLELPPSLLELITSRGLSK